MRKLHVILLSGMFMVPGASAFATGAVANVKKEIKVLSKASTYHASLLHAAGVHLTAMEKAKAGTEKLMKAKDVRTLFSGRFDLATDANQAGPQVWRTNHNQAAETASSLRDKLGLEGARAYVKGLVDSNQTNVKRLNKFSTNADAIAQVENYSWNRGQSQKLQTELSSARAALKAATAQKNILDRQ